MASIPAERNSSRIQPPDVPRQGSFSGLPDWNPKNARGFTPEII
jgi:hypothetical protein